MSLLKYQLTHIEEKGLLAHHLPAADHSQLSDCFRLGVRWALENPELVNESEHTPLTISKIIEGGE